MRSREDWTPEELIERLSKSRAQLTPLACDMLDLLLTRPADERDRVATQIEIARKRLIQHTREYYGIISTWEIFCQACVSRDQELSDAYSNLNHAPTQGRD